MNQIIIQNLTKIYGKGENKIYALNEADISIKSGEFVVVLGPSGSGKSTLLNILGGMDSATSGSVKIGDKEITGLNAKELEYYRRNDIGFVFQFYNLMPNLTALENVQLAENKNSLKSKDILETVGLAARLHNFPAQLSGGEQQRVAIARAIVKRPKMLLCDEPTGALDSKTGKNILSVLTKYSKENNTVIVVTHNAKIAEAADRVIRLSDGKVAADDIQKTPKKAEDIEF